LERERPYRLRVPWWRSHYWTVAEAFVWGVLFGLVVIGLQFLELAGAVVWGG
jgi:hypothetical protein